MLQDTDVQSLLAARKPNHSLPRPFYTDPDIFQLDLERICYRSWLFTVPACELPKPGNYVTHKVGLYSVIIVRGADGVIRAFHNSCRHRGSTLCRATKGTNPKIVCPYHQWTYELDGRLLWARDMDAGFDPSQHGLNPVHCRDVTRPRLHLPRRRGPAFDAFAEEAEPLPRAARPRQLQGRLREHHRREGQLEARLGEQPRVLPLRRQPPVADPHLPRGPAALAAASAARACPTCSTGTSPAASSSAPPRPSRSTRRAAGASSACRCSAPPRATPWTARPRSRSRTRLPVQGRRRAPGLQLPVDLEPLPRRPRDRLPRHPDQRDRDRGLHQVAGPQGRAGGRRLRPQAPDRGLGRHQRRGPRRRREQPAGHPLPGLPAWPLLLAAGERRDPVRRLVRRHASAARSPTAPSSRRSDPMGAAALAAPRRAVDLDRRRAARVLRRRPRGARRRHHQLRLAERRLVPLPAGQFLTLELPVPGGTIWRTYTISSSPSRPLTIAITVKAAPGSIGTRWMLDHLRPGCGSARAARRASSPSRCAATASTCSSRRAPASRRRCR